MFVSCFFLASAESGAIVLDAEFDKFVLQLCDALHVPGLSLAVIDKHSFKSKVHCAAIVRVDFSWTDVFRAMVTQCSQMSKLHQILCGSQAARPKLSRQPLLRLLFMIT